MGFRFLHLADVHLDTPFQSREAGLRALLRDSIRQAFEAAVDLALESEVHALLIAGDLFDNDTLSFATEKFLLEQIRRLEQGKIAVFYAPGNHDPGGSSSRISQISWPSNVYIFDSTQPKTCPVVDSQGRTLAMISGAGHEQPKEDRNLVNDFPVAEAGIPHIGLLHTMVTSAEGHSEHERYAPCALSNLEEKGYTYWALGHIHTRTEMMEKPLVIYPGNLMGRNPGEEGAKGAYLVEIDHRGEAQAAFRALAPVCWTNIKVANLLELQNFESLEQQLSSSIKKQLGHREYSEKLFLRVVLEGPCPLYQELKDEDNLSILAEDLKKALNLEYLELSGDGLVRSIDPESYRSGTHVLNTALAVLDELKFDDDLLLRLKPEKLAANENSGDEQQIIAYLRSLLEGLEFEAAASLLEDEAK